MLKGVAASPGIAIGRAWVLQENVLTVEKRLLPKSEIKAEMNRFKAALEKTSEELSEIEKEALKRLPRRHARLFEAYLLIIDDPLLKDDVLGRISKEGVCAEYALQETVRSLAQAFENIQDEYLRERATDVVEAGKKIFRHLLKSPPPDMHLLREEHIVIARNLSPADTIVLRKSHVLAFATDIGGRTSHTAILAQALEIPAVLGLKDITRKVQTGDMLIVDGIQGVVIVNPEETALENYRREKQKHALLQQELSQFRDLPAVTQDGKKVELAANLEIPEELSSIISHGAEGIGLYRTEYLYLQRNDLPSEEEQFTAYKHVAESMLPHSVIVRTVDIGGDKFLARESETPREANPFLGLRGIRYCLKYPEVFKTQLRAILRATAYGNIKLMFPMISGVSELREALVILEEAKKELSLRGISFQKNIECGCMIEVPSAALTADLLAREASFLSIGTNDLIQYTLAVDRVNENVTHLYEPMHLSVLRLLKHIIDAGHLAGKWVGLCGEMAADPSFTKVLLGLGLDEFSVAAIALPQVKKIIRSTTLQETKELAQDVLGAATREEFTRLLGREHAS